MNLIRLTLLVGSAVVLCACNKAEVPSTGAAPSVVAPTSAASSVEAPVKAPSPPPPAAGGRSAPEIPEAELARIRAELDKKASSR